jgi:hypothetical protein
MREPRPLSQKGCSAGLSSIGLCPLGVALRALSVTDALAVLEQGAPGSGLANLRRAATPILFAVLDERASPSASGQCRPMAIAGNAVTGLSS